MRAESESVHEASISTWRDRIISNILKEGLLPSAILASKQVDYIGSAETYALESVYGRVVRGNGDVRARKKSLESGLYGKNNTELASVLPVILERYHENFPLTKASDSLLEKRAKASFLVVCEADVLSDFEVPRKVVPSEEFLALIFPEPIWSSYVGRNRPYKPEVSLVHDVRPVLFAESARSLSIPNYEDKVLELLNKYQKPLWAHGVRLPTEQDLYKKIRPERQ